MGYIGILTVRCFALQSYITAVYLLGWKVRLRHSRWSRGLIRVRSQAVWLLRLSLKSRHFAIWYNISRARAVYNMVVSSVMYQSLKRVFAAGHFSVSNLFPAFSISHTLMGQYYRSLSVAVGQQIVVIFLTLMVTIATV